MRKIFGHVFAIMLAAPFLGAAAASPHQHGGDLCCARRVVEVVFVLDTTGSMGPLIEGAKRKIWSIATAIVEENPNAEVRMGLVAYRDIGDDYVTKSFPLTGDIQGIYGELLGLRAKGGGDWPESVNEALDAGVTKINWSDGPASDRILFLVGDAPPHMHYAQDRKYPETLTIARKRGIIVNAVQAGNARDTERVWRSVAQLGAGRYIPIPQDGGAVVSIETPYDREIIELQLEINRTIVPYGSPGQQSSVKRKAASVAAAPAPAASDMASYMRKSKRGKDAITGEGDLVSDVAAGRQRLEAVREEELPEALRRASPAERRAIVEEKSRERGALSSRMDGLVKQRDGFIAQAQAVKPKAADSFDEAVKTTLREQMKR